MTDDKRLIKIALKEAIFTRQCDISYDEKHPGIHEPEDIKRAHEEIASMQAILKEFS